MPDRPVIPAKPAIQSKPLPNRPAKPLPQRPTQIANEHVHSFPTHLEPLPSQTPPPKPVRSAKTIPPTKPGKPTAPVRPPKPAESSTETFDW